MPINSKNIDDLNEDDIQELVRNQVMESRTLDYKESLPDDKPESKHKFLASVSAFANTLGGDLIYGIREEAGIACEVSGLEVSDVDAECLRLDSVIQSGLDPKIPGVRIQPISLENNRVVILLRIPRSWAQPHMIKSSSRFYGRNSNGNSQLDVRQIRDAFLLTEAVTDRIRAFRHQRLELVSQGEAPIALNNPKRFLALHIMPIEAFTIGSQFNVNSLMDDYPQPLSMINGSGRRLNFDGLLSFDVANSRSSTNSYVQVFREGIIEAIDIGNLATHEAGSYINASYEHMVIRGLRNLLAVQQKLGVEPPLFVGLSFIGVKGHRLGFHNRDPRYRIELIDRDNLLIQEVVIEDYRAPLAKIMKPAFDAIWNASGLPQSNNYDMEGNWIGGKI